MNAEYRLRGWKRVIEQEFEVKLPRSVRILFAAFTDEDYEGNAFVLFEQDGKYYEVWGSHCSCSGFEGQWEPEESDFQTLRQNRFYSYEPKTVTALHRLLDRLEKKQAVA